MTNLSIIVAVTANNAIGAGGDLLFHISDDLRRFKQLTLGHPVVMGRRTFESLPAGPLPGRLNIVISRNLPSPADASYMVARSLDEAVTLASAAEGGNEIFIIGGGEIYRQALPLADKIYLTCIDTIADNADTFFPETDPSLWHITESSETRETKSGIKFRFITLQKEV
ncbi:MAG: dihydrofolate reductase [Muribaculaceae bacterium]|nr:dihydrofolate reductase [Muribaculaceae bacterium]